MKEFILNQILEFYRQLGAVRCSSEALNKGKLRFLEADDDVLIYERSTQNEQIMVFVNRGNEAVYYAVENAEDIVPVFGEIETYIDENNDKSVVLEPEKAYIVKIIPEGE